MKHESKHFAKFPREAALEKKALRDHRTRKKSRRQWHARTLLLAIYDILAVTGAYFLSLWMRFDCQYSSISDEYLMAWLQFAPLYAGVCFVTFWILRLYHSLWRFASYDELFRIIFSSLFTSIFHGVVITILFQRMPIFYYVVGAGIQFFLILAIRFSFRFILLERSIRQKNMQKGQASRVMLIGAGVAGQLILRDIQSAKDINDHVCCIIDDDRAKWGMYIDGVPIVGGRQRILSSVKKYRIKKIYLAIPSASTAQRREILQICKETGCKLKNLPSMHQLMNGPVEVNAMQEVNIEDLLGREPIRVQMNEIFSFISGKVILVTGGGGSIGSELCRQIAQHNPKQLLIFDIYENNAHAIQLELRDAYPDLNLEVLIGSVRDSKRINQIFETYRPEIVYHAAAHKHVPLMEDSPCEAIKNNAIGTYKTAYAAMMNGCKRFVLISTDKAVNPTNIMGASKRICEMVIQSFDRKIQENKVHEIMSLHAHTEDTYDSKQAVAEDVSSCVTEFVAVRFGNVLGSNGSVVPRFKEQIAHGGPVTVTHPDIIRYFMTIPEAVSLVLQAGTYANGGEIFVLDMGAPVKIDTLARDLIRLSGLEPDVDIQIAYTGLRPGEKLFEEKLMSEEGLRTTPNRLVHIGSPIPFDEDEFIKQLQKLMEIANDGREEETRTLVAKIVPTYCPNGEQGAAEIDPAIEEQMRDMTMRANESFVDASL